MIAIFIIQNYTKSFDFDKRIYQYKRTQNEPIGAERRKGAGEYGPQCPHRGLSRSDWGVEEKAHAVRSDAKGLGNTVPSAPPGLSRRDWG